MSDPGRDSGFPETPERVDVALVVAVRQGRCLVARRPLGTHLAGLWEFPGGKVAPGEEPAEAARRELREETGLVAFTLEPLTLVVHDYIERPLRFHVFLCLEPRGDLQSEGAREWGWVEPAELEALDMPEANRAMLRALRWRLAG